MHERTRRSPLFLASEVSEFEWLQRFHLSSLSIPTLYLCFSAKAIHNFRSFISQSLVLLEFSIFPLTLFVLHPRGFTMPSSDPESSKRDSDLSATPMPKLRRPGVLTRMRWAVEDWVEEMNVTRFMYHILSVIYLCFILLLAYLVLPLPGHWPAQRDADNLPLGRYDNLHQ